MARAKITLPRNWLDISKDNPGGPPTFCRDSDDSGALQISVQAEYESGEVPNPTAEDLVGLAENTAIREPGATIRERLSGTCAIGTFGSVVTSWPDCPHVQIWWLSDGRDLVLATHICSVVPPVAEIREARQIIQAAVLRKGWLW
jgi:hypothetical protein